MSTLYLITGPAGVGKSTVSNELVKKFSKSALIEGDDIYHFVKGGYVSPWMEGNHLEVFWKNSISLINNFLNNGYDVVFNYIIETEKLEYLKDNINSNKIKFICLMTDSDTLVKRDKERPLDCQMNERVLVLLDSFKKKKYNDKYLLDTTSMSVDDVVNYIIENDLYL